MQHRLCSVSDIPVQGSLSVPFFGRDALVYRAGGQPVATVALCPHLGGPLALADGVLACPWHAARFDAATGRCLAGPLPADTRAMLIPTRIVGDGLFYVWGE